MGVLEIMLHESHARTEEATHLLSGSALSVYALEGEAFNLRHIVSAQNEEMAHASQINDEMNTSLNHLT